MKPLRLLILTSFLCLFSFSALADVTISVNIDSHRTTLIGLLIPKGNTTISVEPDTYSRLSCRFYDPKSGYLGLEQNNYSACNGFITLNSPIALDVYITNMDKDNHNYTLTINPTK